MMAKDRMHSFPIAGRPVRFRPSSQNFCEAPLFRSVMPGAPVHLTDLAPSLFF